MKVINFDINKKSFRYSLKTNADSAQTTVILLGAMQYIESLSSYVEEAQRYSTVYVVELPGTGKNPALDSCFRIEDQTAYLRDFLCSQKIKKAHIVAFSYSTSIAVELSKTWPVLSLSICCGVPSIPRSTRNKTKRMLSASTISALEFANEFTNCLTVKNTDIPRNSAIIRSTKSQIAKFTQADIDVFFENTVRLMTYSPDLTHFQVPTVVVVGEYDPYVTVNDAREFASTINAYFVVLNNADHMIHIEYPERLSEILFAQVRCSNQLDKIIYK